MKKTASVILLGCVMVLTAYASDSIWRVTCLAQEKECRSLWAATPLPATNANIVIAYNATENSRHAFDTSFTVNLNDIALAPEQNAISLSGDNANTISIPIIAKDASGVTAQFTNPATVTQILKILSESKTISISFMEFNAKNITVVDIPPEGFAEQLAKVPHGDRLFIQRP